MKCQANLRTSVFPHLVAPAPHPAGMGLLPAWHYRRYGWSIVARRCAAEPGGLSNHEHRSLPGHG